LSGSKVSKRYAKALLSIGQEDNKFKDKDQDRLVSEFIERVEKLH